jgi:short-subunit dehydrogenase
MDIQNKVAIVTGASEGIGKALAELLAANGAKVVLAARSKDKLEDMSLQIPNSLAVPTDMAKPADIKNLVTQTIKKFGRIDILVNNAGRGYYGPVEEIDPGHYRDLMEVNIVGPSALMREVIPHMRNIGGGAIVNVSSRLSKLTLPGFAAYASTKIALNYLSAIARLELGKDNISVGVIYPKMTATNFGLHALNARTDARAGGLATGDIDSPQQVAEKIVELIETGEAEASM